MVCLSLPRRSSQSFIFYITPVSPPSCIFLISVKGIRHSRKYQAWLARFFLLYVISAYLFYRFAVSLLIHFVFLFFFCFFLFILNLNFVCFLFFVFCFLFFVFCFLFFVVVFVFFNNIKTNTSWQGPLQWTLLGTPLYHWWKRVQ